MAEFVLVIIELVHGAHGVAQVAQILGEDPRISLAAAILLLAGAFVAILIRRVRRDEPLSIRNKARNDSAPHGARKETSNSAISTLIK